MSDKIWLGAIYLKDEGGYEIILRSLNHYKKRLKTLGSSPELKNSSAIFGSLLQQEAMKTIPKIDEMTKKIKDALSDDIVLNSLSEDRAFLVKALSCYESDINKAQNTGQEYFLKLVGDLPFVKKDLDLVKNAVDKINQFSD